MALRATIHHHVPATHVPRKASAEFKGIVDLSKLNEPFYTVICFPGKRGEATSIVDSKTISKAIAKAMAAGDPDPIVTIAHSFTAEALEVLEAHSAFAFRKHDFYWSDEGWAGIRDKQR